MSRWLLRCGVVIAIGLWATGTLPAHAQPDAPPAAAVVDSAALRPMPLTDAQLKGFFDAMDELKKLGKIESSKGAPNPGLPDTFARSLRLSEDSTAILQKNGFKNAADFQSVAYNAALAYSVFRQGGKDALAVKQAQAKAQQVQALEKLGQHLSPEQVQMLAANLDKASAFAQALQDVPPQNVELIKPYTDRMKALGAR